MTFQEVCAEVVKQAKDENRLIYLYRNRIGKFSWGASHQYWDDWLFKAYPGGRTVLSLEGQKLLQSIEPANTRLQADECLCPRCGGSLAHEPGCIASPYNSDGTRR